MKEKKINTVKAWPELKLVQDFQLFIRFANFYQRFIQGFNKIAAPLILILKISPQPSSVLPAIRIDNRKVISSSGENDRKSAKSDFTKPVQRVEKPSFLTSDARQVFT